MSNFITKIRFTKNGPTDSSIINMGGVQFSTVSPCSSNGTCAFFTPVNDESGLIITNTLVLKRIQNGDFSIYFKYKLDPNSMTNFVPILSYNDQTTPIDIPLLFIQDNSYFEFYLGESDSIRTRDIGFTFDNYWHTFTITRQNGLVNIFIDGNISNYANISSNLNVGNQIIIGRRFVSTDNIYSINNGYLDDICILDWAIYTKDFIPPSNYFKGYDSAYNYLDFDTSTSDTMIMPLRDAIDSAKKYTKTSIRNESLGFIPRRLRITWNQNNGYFENSNYQINKNNTIINIVGAWQPLLKGVTDLTFNENCYNLLLENKLEMFILFVNKRFVKLSQIELIRSHWWWSLNITGLNNIKITSVELFVIPFPVVYEEGMGIRNDLTPLYSFTNDGIFDNNAAYTYIYMDSSKKSSHLHCLPIIQEQDYSFDNNFNDRNMMKFHWRYGTLDLYNVDQTSDSCIVSFRALDGGGWVTRNVDKVLLYVNGVLMDPDTYNLIGDDLIQINHYSYYPNLLNKVITLQVITDDSKWIKDDFTTVKTISVQATQNNQSVFNIPNVEDSDQLLYRKFLLFLGSTFIENENRYVINDDYTTITLTDPNDYLNIGQSMVFVFVKLLSGDQISPLHVKPYFIYNRIDPPTPQSGIQPTEVSSIDLPEWNNFDFTINNCCIFISDTFITPASYVINNNTFTFTNGYTMNTGEMMVICVLKMVDEFEDPTTPRGSVIYNQLVNGKRFVLYDLDIDKNIKISIDNFICFDVNGEFIEDLYGKIYDNNIIKYLSTSSPLTNTPKYLTCVWNDQITNNWANSIDPNNTNFIKNYIQLRQEFYELDNEFSDFMKEFDYTYSNSLHYGENLSKALDYIMCYNQNKLDSVYEKLTPYTRETYDPLSLNNYLIPITDPYYKYSYNNSERDLFKDNNYKTYKIYFENGIIPEWYDTLIYNTENGYIFKVPDKFNSLNTLESINISNNRNNIYKLTNKITKLQSPTIYQSLYGSIIVGSQCGADLDSDIIVMQQNPVDINSSIVVTSNNNYNQLEQSFILDTNSILSVSYDINNDITSNLLVQANYNNDLASTIQVDRNTEYDIYSQITVK